MNIKQISAVVAAVLVLSACLGATAKDSRSLPQAHSVCSFCHEFSAESGRTTLLNNSSPDALCTGCHAERAVSGEHRVGMPPKAVSSTLPLVDGKVACVTCHEPHGLSGFPSMLRAEPRALCNRCHLK